MLKRLTLLLCLLLAGYSMHAQIKLGGDSSEISYANPREFEVGRVTVSGTRYIDTNVVKLIAGIDKGDKFQVPGDRISLAIDNLWKQGLFEDVRITATKIIGNVIFLDIYLQERPRISKFGFKGVKKSEADDIREKKLMMKGMVFTDYLEGSVVNTVKEFYIDKGYLDADVHIERTPDSTLVNNVIVTIVVNKGKKFKIEDVVFHGNQAIKTQKLRWAMKDTKRKRWWNPFNSSKYLEETYVRDKSKLLDKYKGKGYRDARIVKDSVYKVSANRVRVDITIDEGHKYYFRNITFVGNSKYSSKQLSNILSIKKGDVYNQEVLDARLYMNPNGYDISSLYMDDGYLFFQVTPVEVLVENDSIDLEIRISEGKQATINKVTVVGNTKTNDRVVMREIRTRPGQLFRRSDIIRTQRELAQLGYFDNEKLSVNPKPNPANGTVDIEYVVEEKPSDQVELSGGWGGGRVVGTLGLSFNNFSARNFFKKEAWRPLPSGDGQKLSIRAQSTGLYYQSYNASFTEPWLGGKKPNSFSVTAFYSLFNSNGQQKYIKDSNGDKQLNPNRSTLSITGLSLGFGKRLEWPDDYFGIYAEASAQQYNLHNYTSIFTFGDGVSNNIFGKLTLSRNSINEPIFPTSGSQLSVSGQWTLPYSSFNNKNYADLTAQERYKWVEYQKYKFTASWFTPLTGRRSTAANNDGKTVRNLVLNTRIGFGFLGMYNREVGLSPFERFYLGGSGLTGFNGFDGREIIALRGYDDQSVSPRSGAAFISKYTLELRYPISLAPTATIFALGFAEAGNSWGTAKEFDPFNVKRSAGVGLRIYLPMFGLLGLDYGWRFDDIPTNPGMQKSQFHFTIGANLGEL